MVGVGRSTFRYRALPIGKLTLTEWSCCTSLGVAYIYMLAVRLFALWQ